jgi:hypothetical protein
MRFSLTTLALSIISISAFAAPSTSSSEIEAESNSTLESRTFFRNCPANTNWKLTKCCPWDSWEVPLKFRCECSTPGKTLSADGRSCVNKCSNSGWKWCNTQCCPEGSDEVHGKCVVSPLPLSRIDQSLILVLRWKTTSRYWIQQEMCRSMPYRTILCQDQMLPFLLD